jgi:hypothetical protein
VADAAPPAKKSGPLRWVLLGCGALAALLVLGMGGCAGALYFIYRGSDPVAKVGSDYLAAAPELRKAFGESCRVDRRLMGWKVSVVNDGGRARFDYDIRTEKDYEAGEAVVWLVRSAGKWSVVGARIKSWTEDAVILGNPPKDRDGIDWD